MQSTLLENDMPRNQLTYPQVHQAYKVLERLSRNNFEGTYDDLINIVNSEVKAVVSDHFIREAINDLNLKGINLRQRGHEERSRNFFVRTNKRLDEIEDRVNDILKDLSQLETLVLNLIEESNKGRTN